MKYFDYIKRVYKKTLCIKGRASLAECLSFMSLWFGVAVLWVICAVNISHFESSFISSMMGWFLGLSFIPMLAMFIRRLHDQNMSAWMLILLFIPLVDFFIIYMLMSPGDKWDNDYGKYAGKTNEVANGTIIEEQP